MKNVHTVIGRAYAVTTSVPCTICTPAGVLITNCEPGEQTTFVSPTKGILVSDDGAQVIEAFRNAAAAGNSSLKAYIDRRLSEVALSADAALQARGREAQQLVPLLEHVEDAAAHLSAAERSQLETLLSSAGRAGEETLPEGALSPEEIRAYFSRNACFGAAVPTVCVARVPWARRDASLSFWVNTEPAVQERVFGCPRRFMDAAEDAPGLFFRQEANALRAEDGSLLPGPIRGSSTFSPTAEVIHFGPAFYFFCCPEQFCDPATGLWRTHDGTQSGTPLFQLWGVSSCAWSQLDDARREELATHGVREVDFHLWPECRQALYWCRSRELHSPEAVAMDCLFRLVQTGSKEGLSSAFPEAGGTVLNLQLEDSGCLRPVDVADETQPPPTIITQQQGDYIHVSLALHARLVAGRWEAERHAFWEAADVLDLADLEAQPGHYLHYIPLGTRREAQEQARLMLEKLRGSNPVVPVPGYGSEAAVCLRPAEQLQLLTGLALGGLPGFELADGQTVSLTPEELRAILQELTTAEILWKQALHQCCATIEAARSEEDIACALADFATLLSGYAVEPITNAMNTNNNNTSWLASLLTGWGIRESWAKIIAGSIAGALAAAGFLTGCSPQPQVLAAAPAAIVSGIR